MVVWLNGQVMDHPVIDAADRGFTLGDGLFETLRLAGGNVRHWSRHAARLQHGARVLGIPLIYSPDQLQAAIAHLANEAGMAEGVVRLTLTRGIGARGLLPPETPSPTVLIAVAPVPAPLGPARVTISTLTRRNEFSPLAGLKSLNYLDAILARQDAAARGFDDVLLLNTQGFLAESSVASVFAVIDGQLCTPCIRDGALPGVARALVIEALGAGERHLPPADLLQADEIVLTNALGARSVILVDQKPVSVGEYISLIQSVIDKS